MDKCKWLIATWWAMMFALIAFAFQPAPSRADETSCHEWATMTQVLIIRWQADPNFKAVSKDDVKGDLSKRLSSHPDFKKALGYVDIAWDRRNDDPIKVWREVYAKCNSVSL